MATLAVKTTIVDESEIRRDSHSLSMFVITHHVTDYPGKVVVREHISRPGQVLILKQPAGVFGTIAEARASIPRGLVRLPRHQSDDPVIVETWV